jgi:hypothetical protein
MDDSARLELGEFGDGRIAISVGAFVWCSGGGLVAKKCGLVYAADGRKLS